MTSKRITSFFKKTDVTDSGLPTPSSSCEVFVNEQVEDAAGFNTPTSKKRKRGAYGDYSPESRSKIAQFAIENGNSKTARHFSVIYKKNINESTVRSMKDSYAKRQRLEKQFCDDGNSSPFPRSPRGRPVKIGKYDEIVQDYIRKLRVSGGIVNSRIVISAAKGFILAQDKTMLQQYGGTITLDKAWASSLMKRMGLCKRKGTKGIKHLPQDFPIIQNAFLKRISDNITKYNIPDELVINWDQTACNYVPVSSWTMQEKGSKQVQITNLDDKRQITVLMACSKSGSLLPPQLLYQGKTEVSHATYEFPDNWDIWHTETHWSNSDSMERYVTTVILPYVEKVRDELDLPLRQRALCVFDIYKAHQGEGLLNLLQKHNIQMVYVPASCTDRLQPLDLSVNAAFKLYMKACFENFYAEEVAKQVQKGDANSVRVDLRLSQVKPLHAKWLVQCFEKIGRDVEMIQRGWIHAGIHVKP